MWCWRRMEKISWADNVKNEEVLPRVKVQRNNLHKIVHGRLTGLVTFWVELPSTTGHWRKEKRGRGVEVTGRWGRRRTKLLDGLKERKGYSHLKEEALDRTVWTAGFGPVIRQTAKWMNENRPRVLETSIYEGIRLEQRERLVRTCPKYAETPPPPTLTQFFIRPF